jgi:VIT1/CCC1 family predicted Fe2+/Mn2+ transporter
MMTQKINDQSQPMEEILYCANHPDRETLLRCNRCGKPICTECAVLTDVGYRCPECIREVQNKYYNADQKDNAIAFGVAFGVALIATPILGFLLGFFGFFFGSIIALMLGSGAGASLAQIIRRSVGKRRGRHLGAFATAGIIVGILVAYLFIPFVYLNIPLLIFTALAISTAYPFLR